MTDDIVGVERKLTGEKKVQAFFMRKSWAELEKNLTSEMKDASRELEFCYRYRRGELLTVTNLKAYGITTSGGGGEKVHDVAKKLLPYYDEWRDQGVREGLDHVHKAIDAVFFEGKTPEEHAEEYFRDVPFRESKVREYIIMGLNEYCILRGWGDNLKGIGMRKFSFLYVVGTEEHGSMFKIGYSGNPAKRLQEMQIGSPVDLKLCYVMRLLKDDIRQAESTIHKELKKYKVRGEWFECDLENIKMIIRILYPNSLESEISST